MSKDNSGPAFPAAPHMPGMTLRDYFAAKAMQGLIYDKLPENELRTAARYSYAMADEMLKARAE
jgi:hypothetical protein